MTVSTITVTEHLTSNVDLAQLVRMATDFLADAYITVVAILPTLIKKFYNSMLIQIVNAAKYQYYFILHVLFHRGFW